MELSKDGRTWQIATGADVAWIRNSTTIGTTITSAVPPVFAAYATFWPPDEEGVSITAHEQAVLNHLVAATPAEQAWWLGFLDTGAHDVVFDAAPRVTLYTGWSYVVVEAGAEQVTTWRTGHMRAQYGTFPDLVFPADHSWLVSALWDDTWTCIGGPSRLVDAISHDPLVEAHSVVLGEDATPPGHQSL